MFGISFLELVVIFVVALLVFGPEKLPEVARFLGKLSADLKKASDGVRREFYNAVYTPAQEDLERTRKELKALKEQFAVTEEFKPHPLCPDTQARLERDKAEQNAGAPTATPSADQKELTQSAPPLPPTSSEPK